MIIQGLKQDNGPLVLLDKEIWKCVLKDDNFFREFQVFHYNFLRIHECSIYSDFNQTPIWRSSTEKKKKIDHE